MLPGIILIQTSSRQYKRFCSFLKRRYHPTIISMKHFDAIIIGSGQAGTPLAKKWLTENIEQFFLNFDKLEGNYSKICTKQYFEYKTDATNVEMGDDGMTKSKFGKKWPNRNPALAGFGAGFMISGQDFGKIKVTKCDLLNKTLTGGWLFATLIEDIQFKAKYTRDIVVVQNKGSFLIDDVLEYD